MRNIWLESSDGRIICVDIGLLLSRSNIVKTSLHLECIHYSDEITIALDISGFVLTRILLWAEYHKNHEDPTWVCNNEVVTELMVQDWDKEFLREPKSNLEAIMDGAHYLKITWLEKLCAYKLQLLVEQYMRRHETPEPEVDD